MRRSAVAGAFLLATTLASAPATAFAQDEGASPTTVEVETSEVERTVTSLDVEERDTAANDDDDDSDNTGLWGLLGLLGLLGLAGLAGRRRSTADSYAPRTTGPPPRGATTPND